MNEGTEAVEPPRVSEAHEAAGDAQAARRQSSPAVRLISLIVLGCAIGTWGAVCGIGGGLFAVPLLHYVYKLSLRESVATSLVLVAASTTSATATELLRADSALHLPSVLALVVGSVCGARIGFLVAQRMGTVVLKQVFVVVLLFVAARIVTGEASTEQVGGIDLVADIGYGLSDYILIAAVGLGGGFVSPLLGVGGGLVAVPALLLLVEPLGYLGTRAASLAMSMCNAWLSITLYHRIGGVRWSFGLWLAAGALAGAILGVWAVHHPGLVPIARNLLAATLTLVSVRFAVDAWRASRSQGQA